MAAAETMATQHTFLQRALASWSSLYETWTATGDVPLEALLVAVTHMYPLNDANALISAFLVNDANGNIDGLRAHMAAPPSACTLAKSHETKIRASLSTLLI